MANNPTVLCRPTSDIMVRQPTSDIMLWQIMRRAVLYNSIGIKDEAGDDRSRSAIKILCYGFTRKQAMHAFNSSVRD